MHPSLEERTEIVLREPHSLVLREPSSQGRVTATSLGTPSVLKQIQRDQPVSCLERRRQKGRNSTPWGKAKGHGTKRQDWQRETWTLVRTALIIELRA